MSIQISNSVWSSNVGDPVAKMVLLKLADNANDQGQSWPSIATICRQTELSERTVQRKMTYLEERGFIRRDRGKNCCDYLIFKGSLNARLIDSTPSESHPVTLTPRHTVTPTPSHSHPYPVTVTVALLVNRQ